MTVMRLSTALLTATFLSGSAAMVQAGCAANIVAADDPIAAAATDFSAQTTDKAKNARRDKKKIQGQGSGAAGPADSGGRGSGGGK